MQCPKCGCTLSIGVTEMTFENDDTPDKETIAYNNLPMICTNKACDLYGGKDLTKPDQVVQVLKQRMN
ncbi:hypothetical protein [Dehalobacter sp. TeCB1]|uniref:hypothetical protein n=1 Tax=Dehalobacter sp. TeCB1 TaxID=1843715 RepID=UPI00083B3035|nr:hypothetical protein [Dehalobacter sp. TeCB1]OCZ54319.1 hypothetical protein A7D23_06000 [Dehalobacter sp. TeCB1]